MQTYIADIQSYVKPDNVQKQKKNNYHSACECKADYKDMWGR